mmetsp:Transcript_6532/g.16895  ORF Transcript_6532/g.16895 Transcript_6532/m.16895 type:complete len:89 (-) Transcript_6532:886-1152(-)
MSATMSRSKKCAVRPTGIAMQWQKSHWASGGSLCPTFWEVAAFKRSVAAALAPSAQQHSRAQPRPAQQQQQLKVWIGESHGCHMSHSV